MALLGAAMQQPLELGWDGSVPSSGEVWKCFQRHTTSACSLALSDLKKEFVGVSCRIVSSGP